MKKRVHLLLIASLACASSLFAGPFSKQTQEIAAQLRDKALKESKPYDIVASLTTEIGPRPAGSPADKAAVAWAMKTLKAMSFDAVYAEPVAVTYWARGEAELTVTAPFPHRLEVTALGGSVGTGDEGIEAEIVEVPSFEALKALPENALQGKIAFLNERMTRSRNGSGYGVTVKNRSYGAIEASKRGALAVVIRSVGTDSHRLPHTGVLRYEADVKKIPSLAVSNPDADLLTRMLSYNKPIRLHLKANCRLIGTEISHNVVAEIHGSQRPEEIVLLGAHLDSWDLGTGAVDDGAGVAIVSEAGRILSEASRRPQRTIRVILFANEEFGLEGAKAYFEQHKDEFENFVMGSESDFGAGPIYAFSTNVKAEHRPVMDEILKVLEPLGIARGDEKASGGPDMWPFQKEGMPVVGLNQDGSDYFDLHHTADDTLDKIDPNSMRQNVAAFAAWAWMVADTEYDFGRIPVDEEESKHNFALAVGSGTAVNQGSK